MRLSKDSGSWHASGVLVRDARSVKSPADERPVGKPGKKKDTKRWCKGKEGREHKKVWVRSAKHWTGWVVERCSVCLREFDYCWMHVPAGKNCPKHGMIHAAADGTPTKLKFR